MIPRSLLSFRFGALDGAAGAAGAAVPDYLGPHDYPWLRALLDEQERFAGRPARELADRLREPLSPDAPAGRRLRAARVLERLCTARGRSRDRPDKPARIRAAVFGAAAARPESPRYQVLAGVAGELGLEPAAVEAGLFADLPSERRAAAPPPSLTPMTLALETNLALVQGLMRRALALRLELRGNARAVVRLARLRGLLCVVERPRRGSADVLLSASGPLALFRRTLVYGRALASLVPGLAWCDWFRLEARCLLDERTVPIEVRAGDPIFPSAEPRRFDSRLEERFARDFGRAALDWEIVREPEPIATPRGIVFPDFLLRHRRDTERSWILEIVGYWTEEYLRHKLETLRAARLDNLIICIDEDKNCGRTALAGLPRVIPFRRRIDPNRVLQLIAPEDAPAR